MPNTGFYKKKYNLVRFISNAKYSFLQAMELKLSKR